MGYNGHVKNGIVVLDEPVQLPEGAKVRVEILESGETVLLDENGQTLGQKLMKHAGTVTGLPPDAALQHDHYLYGTPKK